MSGYEVSSEICRRCKNLILTDEQIQRVMRRLLCQIEKGLKKSSHEKAEVKCFVTYVQDLPNGREHGKFLALDLGGTNFRVLMIHLKSATECEMESDVYEIPQDLMLGTGIHLFDHIAQCLSDFIQKRNLASECLSLGFTFSFPLKQLGLTKGTLVRWTKGFNCAGVVGEDVVQMLKEAIERRGDVQIEVCAILNDTTGTLMSCAWKDYECKVGLIVGTGSNACYVEKVENAELFDGERSEKRKHVVINTEWGAFGDHGCLDFIRTEYDLKVDAKSINPGKQIFEKMISGMYMGELVRLILVKFANEKLLFGGTTSEALMEKDRFKTKYVSKVEQDPVGQYNLCLEVLHEKLGLSYATERDCANVRFICECVSSRAACLASAGIVTLLNKMAEKKVTVGVDGSVYRFHPKFHDLMVNVICKYVNPGIEFKLMLSEDGSGRGAALVAAVAARDERRKTHPELDFDDSE